VARGREFPLAEDDYCPLYSLLATKPLVRCSRDLCRHPYARGTSTRAHTRAHTHRYVCACRGYISQRRSSLYVNCIRNSEYPANFLHTDHSRISAKRTSIRRSLHHKFRRTWCNAHLAEAPTLHSGCAPNERVPLRDVAILPYRFTRFPCFRYVADANAPRLLVERIEFYGNFLIQGRERERELCTRARTLNNV